MAKRSDHSGGTALKTRPRAGRIVLWAVLAALLLGAVIGVVSLLGRPSGAETPENTAAPTAAPDTSGTPSETPLPEELREAPLSPEAEIAASAAVRSNGFPMLAWAPDGFSADSRGRMQYSGGKYLTGIDVSEHQYDIDWEKVAADGIDFAMIRVGYRGSTAGQIYTDEYFEKNIAGATAAGLKGRRLLLFAGDQRRGSRRGSRLRAQRDPPVQGHVPGRVRLGDRRRERRAHIYRFACGALRERQNVLPRRRGRRV